MQFSDDIEAAAAKAVQRVRARERRESIMATTVDELAPSTTDKVLGNLQIMIKSISTYVIAAATALLWWWLGLSSAEQAAKLADYPQLLNALPIVTPILIFVSRLLPQKAVTQEMLKQVEQNANVTIIPGAPPA